MNRSTDNGGRSFWHRLNSPPLLLPLGILLVLTGLIRVFDIDLKVASHFYDTDTGWYWGDNPVLDFLYHYGTWPGIVVGVVGLGITLYSLFAPHLARYRKLSLYLALVLVVGPGLIINVTFKENFGRPRPRNVEQFGGERTFLPVGQPYLSQRGRSFPSGHASMGFYWLCLGVYFWERRRSLAWAGLALGLVYGGLMGLARIVQGAHWLSDVVWSAGFVYLTAWILYRVLRLSPAYSTPQDSSDAADP